MKLSLRGMLLCVAMSSIILVGCTDTFAHTTQPKETDIIEVTDPSCVQDLARVTTDLARVTAERDVFKANLDNALEKITYLENEIGDLRAERDRLRAWLVKIRDFAGERINDRYEGDIYGFASDALSGGTP